jgi:hypothetical protein
MRYIASDIERDFSYKLRMRLASFEIWLGKLSKWRHSILRTSESWKKLPHPANIGGRLHLIIEFTYKRNWPGKPDRGIVKSLISLFNQKRKSF